MVMKLTESGNYLFITIEDHDWKFYGRRLLETIKSVPGRIYIPQSKEWRISNCRRHLLSGFVPPFTEAEEKEGLIEVQDFLDQFDSHKEYIL